MAVYDPTLAQINQHLSIVQKCLDIEPQIGNIIGLPDADTLTSYMREMVYDHLHQIKKMSDESLKPAPKSKIQQDMMDRMYGVKAEEDEF